MGNFHCIPSNCARIIWREYLPPTIRWRYPGEEWLEIVADDYLIDQQQGQCKDGFYKIRGKAICTSSTRADVKCDDEVYWIFGHTINGKILNITPLLNELQPIRLKIDHVVNDELRESFDYIYEVKENLFGIGTSLKWKYFPYCQNNSRHVTITHLKDIYIERLYGLPDNCGECIFTAYLKNNIVYQETRDVCPEVEQLPCRLDDISKEIKIEKLPYLERVEVVPYAYQNFAGSVYQAIIPDECLNIYKNLTTTIIPQFEGFPTPTNANEASYGFVKQICSAPGCPPPEYTVICDCDQVCPDGTCEVICGSHICCYDSQTGISQKSIPISLSDSGLPDNLADPGG